MQDGRVKTMERWLANKKLNEAYKITQMRDDTQHQDDVVRDMRQHERSNAKSYKQWMTQKSM